MKDILIPLDTTDLCKQRLDAALLLAEKFDAHLTGYYAQRELNLSLYGESITGAVMEAFETQLRQEKACVTELFEEKVARMRSRSTLRIEKTSGGNQFFKHAQISDLVVAGQIDPEGDFIGVNGDPEDIVMGCARPVLIVPYIGFQETIGDNIMIAWDKGRESSRAIHDAMPLLQKAGKVSIFSAVDRFEAEKEWVAADLAEHLARHDVIVDTLPTVRGAVSVAETLLSRVSDVGADLIVMGAYGHSRLREYTLGGTTRTIFKSMTVPVLMSH